MGRYSRYKPKNVLKQFAYQLARICKKKGVEEELREFLEEVLRANGRRVQKNPGQQGANNIFFLCLHGLDPAEQWTKSGEVSRLSRQLQHAEASDVPSKYLIGYIYQTGGKYLSQSQPENEAREKEEQVDNWDG
ncbi:hypothetical protein [Leisingera sp. M523]|uniref:hypothetical protein n=1 Tax=Leisingera sp. M523 TaxID=2867013 RepID=UPI0021A8B39F|nr:hypothetical protein [Leisingera sp. M523]UWQ28859.1 hypothetical protein K3557_19345 [Leisingera sp. M523]